MADDGQHIQHERQEPSYFAMIPKMALMDLSPYELTLYCHYKQIASESGACYMSNKALAAQTKMSVSQLKRARAELERRHYITVTHHADAATGVENAPVTVTIKEL